jgi:hypothetical protein
MISLETLESAVSVQFDPRVANETRRQAVEVKCKQLTKIEKKKQKIIRKRRKTK